MSIIARFLVAASFVDDCRHGNITYLSEKTGYLALFSRPERFSGSPIRSEESSKRDCSWIIAVSSGQKINVTWQVSSASTFVQEESNDGGLGMGGPVDLEGPAALQMGSSLWCPFVLRFLEGGSLEYVHRTCRSRAQEPRVIYLSKGSRLEIQSKGSPQQQQQLQEHLQHLASLSASSSSSATEAESNLNTWKPYVLHYRGRSIGPWAFSGILFLSE